MSTSEVGSSKSKNVIMISFDRIRNGQRAPASADRAAVMQSVRRLVIDAHWSFAQSRRNSVGPSAAMPPQEAATHKQLPPCNPGYRQLYEQSDLDERLNWAATLSSDTRRAIERQLLQSRELGQYRRVVMAPDPDSLHELQRDFPNFSEVTQYLQRRLSLCRAGPEQLCKLPALLLAGPPGTGKTAYSKRLARLLDMGSHEIDVSGLGASFSITGLDLGFATGGPGLIWAALQSECMSQLILLDELDKIGTDTNHRGIDFLLGLLEPVSAVKFQDAAIRMPIDASYLTWIATCNDSQAISAPIRSRFRTFHIAAPAHDQMTRVVTSIHRDLMSSADWSAAFPQSLDMHMVNAIAEQEPRAIRQLLEDAYALAASAGKGQIGITEIRRAQTFQVSPIQRKPIGFIP